MDIRPIANDFAVSAQITADEVREVAAAGYRTIISNRPDAEQGAVPHDEIEKAATAAGLQFRYIPVVSGAITPQNVEDMAAALADVEGPVLAYCRSGGRCTSLYGLVSKMKG